MPMIDLEDAATVAATLMAESLAAALEVGYAAREQGTALGAIVAVAALLFPRTWLVDGGFATEQQLGGAPAVWLAHCSRCAGKVGALPEGMPLLLARQTPPEELH